MLPQEIIIKKRKKQKLSKEDIQEFIDDIISNKADDAQIAAFTMEVLLNKLSKEERVNLTMAMANSGKVLSYKDLNLKKPIIDKHSTGGVGDKVSLMLAPIVACLGICNPMIAGRGLGHTGGTIDKLESIPGYNCYPNEKQFKKVIKNVGCGIMGATKDIAPADKKMYAIRDISGTVESMDLITASILSKKLAAGLEGLVMDVKFGNGAFMENKRKAKKLAKYIESVGKGANLKIKAILTDMNSVLGRNVGNSLEVIEVIDFLEGNYDKRLYKVTEKLAVEMLLLGNIYKNRKHAKEAIYKVIHNGEALNKFQEMVSAMGGPKNLSKKDLKIAKYKKDIYPQKTGRVKKIDTHAIGIALIELGGGRTDPEQDIDSSVGFENFCQIGEKIGKNIKPIATIYANKKENINKISKTLILSVKN
ncbi:MAG: thymidine phosphorylase [Alphaproteobacteria bacterium]|jgi:thymidine phosphorylase|nr:thymidine phosphorylase [Alphaproteobacteria bacterium]